MHAPADFEDVHDVMKHLCSFQEMWQNSATCKQKRGARESQEIKAARTQLAECTTQGHRLGMQQKLWRLRKEAMAAHKAEKDKCKYDAGKRVHGGAKL